MKICITDRDQAILRYIEEFKSITIEQCRRIFCNEQKRGDVIARRRLNRLLSYKKIKMDRDKVTNQNVYYMDSKLSFHDLLVMDYYSELKSLGANILYFKIKKEWMDKTIISDAFCCFNIDNKIFFDIIEVNKTHFPDLDKYKKLYSTSEPQEFCNKVYQSLGGNDIDIIPRFILIDNVQHKEDPFINQDVEVIQLDFNLSQIAKLFLVNQ